MSRRPTSPSIPAPVSSPARTPYYYSTYEEEDEVRREENASVVVLGSGPNRIGQGIEFDYVVSTPARRGERIRRGYGQLEPGDRLYRLRHLNTPVLRAAHRRTRARGHKARGTRR